MAVPGQLWVPPLEKNDPLIFVDDSQNLEKSEIITFEAFWAKISKNHVFDNFVKILTWKIPASRFSTLKIMKNTKNSDIRDFSSILNVFFWYFSVLQTHLYYLQT